MPKSNNSAVEPRLATPFDVIELQLRELILDAVSRSMAASTDYDETYGRYSSLFAFAKSAQSLEGNVLRDAMAALVQAAGYESFTEVELPITEGALQAARANKPELLTQIRLNPEVYARESYRGDVVVADAARQRAFLVEVKRSTNSYSPSRLKNYGIRMTAAACMLPSILFRDHGIGVRHVQVLIVDATDSDCRPGTIAKRPSHLETLLEIPGLATGIIWARRVFGQAVQDEIDRRIKLLAQDVPTVDPVDVDFEADHADAEEADTPYDDDGVPNWQVTIGLANDTRRAG